MAGDWIPVTVELPRKREVQLISHETGRSRHEVVGLLVDLWLWASAETATGKIDGLNCRALVALIGADAQFWCAVVRAGWLEEHEDHLVIPHADHWITNGAKARLKNTLRQKTRRAKLSRFCRAKSATKARPEKRREEKNKNTPIGVFSPLPPTLETEQFRAAWSNWLAYRRERRLTLTQRTLAAQLAKLEAWGPAAGAEAIAASIAAGWQGLFDPDKKPANSQPQMRQLVDIDGMEFPDDGR